jgi:REP element-mobilizing transposase RayT
VRRARGRSSRKIQQEFEHIRKRYWGQRFWQRGYFSTNFAARECADFHQIGVDGVILWYDQRPVGAFRS